MEGIIDTLSISQFGARYGTGEYEFEFEFEYTEEGSNSCMSQRTTYDEMLISLSPNVIAFKNGNGYLAFNCVQSVKLRHDIETLRDTVLITCTYSNTTKAYRVSIHKKSI